MRPSDVTEPIARRKTQRSRMLVKDMPKLVHWVLAVVRCAVFCYAMLGRAWAARKTKKRASASKASTLLGGSSHLLVRPLGPCGLCAALRYTAMCGNIADPVWASLRPVAQALLSCRLPRGHTDTLARGTGPPRRAPDYPLFPVAPRWQKNARRDPPLALTRAMIASPLSTTAATLG